jgi:hypothetical protein
MQNKPLVWVREFFIQTIILERLSEAYAKTFQESTETILPDLDNEKLKSALEKVIDSNRSLFATSEDFHKVKGRILNFNKAKRNKTEDKMLNLINFLKIKITPETEHILKEARHYIIHTGEIGEAAKARDNYLYLDKLIREIILSLIEYKGYVKQIQK